MAALSGLKPAEVFHYFEDICAIPHGSGNTDEISSYLCEFADEHGLEYEQDEVGNVVIYKPASDGSGSEPVILQAHMDMVAVSDDGRDMETCGIETVIDGDHLTARGTSLGGDDGMGVAYILAILASDEIHHPAIEAVFTVDEETGMDGARALDPRLLLGRRMINLDSEEEGHILAGCAGGARVYLSYKYDLYPMYGLGTYRIDICGCSGGHSGNEIHKGGANANILAGRILYETCQKLKIRLIDICGGTVDNAIPVSSYLIFALEQRGHAGVEAEEVERIIDEIKTPIIREYAVTDPDMSITLKSVEPGEEEKKSKWSTVLDIDTTKYIGNLLKSLPNGVMSMSSVVPGLVETSLNLGVMFTKAQKIHLQFSVRSSVGSAKQALIDRLNAIAELGGTDVEISGEYPGWEYRKESGLRDVMSTVYAEMYGDSPIVEAIHAGLECGFFAEKIPDLDCVSIGPDMADIHTTSEKLSISSTQRTWDYLCRVLDRLC